MPKCEFCNKILKTDKGFQNHMCEKKKRFVYFNEPAFYVWLLVCNLFKIRIPDDDNEKKLAFINDSFYTKIANFTEWVLDMDVVNLHGYLSFLKKNNIKINNWIDSHIYKIYLEDFIEKEPVSIAIKRSEDYLLNQKVTLDTISSNKLMLAIKYGRISKKYLKYKNFDVKSKLDEGQWKAIKNMILSVEDRINESLSKRG